PPARSRRWLCHRRRAADSGPGTTELVPLLRGLAHESLLPRLLPCLSCKGWMVLVPPAGSSAPGVTRTRGQQFRKLLLYPSELRGQLVSHTSKIAYKSPLNPLHERSANLDQPRVDRWR